MGNWALIILKRFTFLLSVASLPTTLHSASPYLLCRCLHCSVFSACHPSLIAPHPQPPGPRCVFVGHLVPLHAASWSSGAPASADSVGDCPSFSPVASLPAVPKEGASERKKEDMCVYLKVFCVCSCILLSAALFLLARRSGLSCGVTPSD